MEKKENNSIKGGSVKLLMPSVSARFPENARLLSMPDIFPCMEPHFLTKQFCVKKKIMVQFFFTLLL
jgi:hypothetical protein